MARAKPRWRRVLNARFLRWRLTGMAVRLFPVLGRRLGFFPDHIDMIVGADRVLADDRATVPPDTLSQHMEFLRLCQPNDSHAPGVELPNGVVTGRRTALFDRPWIDVATGSVLLPRKARTVLVRGERANWNATSARFSRARIAVPGRAFAPLVSRNYFHVILENGIRLIDLLESGAVADAPLTVVRPDLGQVTRDMLAGIATLYPDLTVREVPAGALVIPDQAVVHFPRDNYWEWPPVTRTLADRLALAFAAVHRPFGGSTGQRLYLSRRGAKLRNPLNAEDLEAALAARGFDIFQAHDGNHSEQIARFGAARKVVAVHGAGLANLVFCRPGTEVIEIFPKNFIKSPYWRLAQGLDLPYRAVIGGPGDYDQRFVVNVDAVLHRAEG